MADDPKMVELIKKVIRETTGFSKRMLGDTPNDANQLVPKKYVDGKTYKGYVASNVASTPFPKGWTLNHSGTGTYVVTHNLNTTNYIVLSTSSNQLSVMKLHGAVGANSFQLDAQSVGGAFQDSDFVFTVIT